MIIINCNDSSKGNDENIEISKCEKISLNVGNQKREIIFSFKSLEVTNSQRVWKNINMIPKLKIGSIEDETFYFPGRIRIDKDENIYVLDFKDYSVKKFDSSGNFIQKFGKKGKGPGELTTSFDFNVFNDGKVILLGLNDNKFILFEKREIKDIMCTLTPIRICFINSNEALTFQILDPVNNLHSKNLILIMRTLANIKISSVKKALEEKILECYPFWWEIFINTIRVNVYIFQVFTAMWWCLMMKEKLKKPLN